MCHWHSHTSISVKTCATQTFSNWDFLSCLSLPADIIIALMQPSVMKSFKKNTNRLFLPFLYELSPPLPPFFSQPLEINQAENVQLWQSTSAGQVSHEEKLLLVTYSHRNRILHTSWREMGGLWFPLKHKKKKNHNAKSYISLAIYQ